MAISLGMDYVEIGYGLHPVIALPIATVLVGLPLMWEVINWMDDREDEFEHIVLEQAHCSDCGQHRDLINGRCVNLNACLNSR